MPAGSRPGPTRSPPADRRRCREWRSARRTVDRIGVAERRRRCRGPPAASRAECRTVPADRRPIRRDGCRTAACARRWWRRWHATRAAGQPPDQEAVDRAEGQAFPPRPRRGAPSRCRAARRSWWRRNTDRAAARCARRSASRARPSSSASQIVGGAAVLPDDGVVDRLAGAAVPDHHGLALVGDADGGDVGGGKPGVGQGLPRGGDDGCPDFLRIVLHPAGSWVNAG